MIKNFSDPESELIAAGEYSKKLPVTIQRTARKKLRQLDAAASIDDLRMPPGNHLKALRGNRVGQYSIRINAQWRLCFSFHNGDVFDVEIVDYH